MRWNDTDGTVDIGLKGGNVTLQLGQEQLARVVNKTSPSINLLEANYQVVKVVGATGQRLSVALAQANSSLNSAVTLGIVTETINANQEGFVTTSGQVREINTTGSLQGESWNDGDILYLSSTTAGAITKVRPSAPNKVVVLGFVEYAHSQHGKIFVKVDTGLTLDELDDVSATTPSNNDGLFFNTSTQNWENKSISTALGFTPEPVISAGTISQYYRGDKSWQTLNSEAVFGANTVLISDGIAGTPVTGGTSFTKSLIKSYLIPANTFASGDIFEIWAIGSKVNTNTAWYIDLSCNTTNTLTGSTQLGRAFSANSTTIYLPFQRIINFTSSNQIKLITTSGANFISEASTTVAQSTISFDSTVNNYLFFSVVPVTGATADIMNIEKVLIIKSKYKATI